MINFIKSYIVLLVSLFVFSTSQAQIQETDIMMKMLELKNGLLKKDSVLLTRILADDVTYGHSNGVVETKSQLIRAVMSGDQDYKVIETGDMKLRFYDNTA